MFVDPSVVTLTCVFCFIGNISTGSEEGPLDPAG